MKSRLFLLPLGFLTVLSILMFRNLPSMYSSAEKDLFYIVLFTLVGITLVGAIRMGFK